MQRLVARPTAAPQALAVQRDQVSGIGPQRQRPVREAGLEQRRRDPVEHHPQPVLLGRAEVIL